MESKETLVRLPAHLRQLVKIQAAFNQCEMREEMASVVELGLQCAKNNPLYQAPNLRMTAKCKQELWELVGETVHGLQTSPLAPAEFQVWRNQPEHAAWLAQMESALTAATVKAPNEKP